MAGGQAEIEERLLARNALVNAPDSQGHTVLWIALHSLAITTRAQKSAPVDTAAVADVLRRHVGSECAKERALGDLCGYGAEVSGCGGLGSATRAQRLRW